MSSAIPIGIDAISIYVPKLYLDIRLFAEARKIDPGKFNDGLGLEQMAITCPHEDPVTMAVVAARRLFTNYSVNPDSIGLLIVASESPVDTAKATAAYVHGLLGLSSHCRVFDVKQACYGGTAAIRIASEWCASKQPSRRKFALVIASDIAQYEADSPGEPTQGAGAVAMLVSVHPRILTIDPFPEAIFTEDIMDFWRPTYRHEAVVNGKLSIKEYLKALEHTYLAHRATSRLTIKDYQYLLFHTPFPKMAQKAHDKLCQIEFGQPVNAADQTERTTAFEQQTSPTLFANKAVGNIYTGAVYLSLAALLDHPSIRVQNDQIGFFSYGSGATAEFFSGRIGPEPAVWRHKTGIASIEARTPVDYNEYRRLKRDHGAMSTNGSYGIQTVCACVHSDETAFFGIENHKRIYTRNGEMATELTSHPNGGIQPDRILDRRLFRVEPKRSNADFPPVPRRAYKCGSGKAQ